MLFADPDAAFTRLARALRPGGCLSFVTWRGAMANAWFTVPLAAAGEHVDLSRVDVAPGPGPFAFAEANLVRGVLHRAGFVDVQLESLDEPVWVGDDPDDAAAFFEGANGHKLSAVSGEELLPKIVKTLRELLMPFAGPTGVRLPASAWLVTARAPH